MANPQLPHIVEGVVRKGLTEDIQTKSDTVGTAGGQTVNLSLSDGTELAEGLTVTLTRIASKETLTVNTNSVGEYAFDLANIESFEEGDAFTVSASTITATLELLERSHTVSKSMKIIPVDQRGDEYTEDYPIPVKLADQVSGHPDVLGNVSTTWTITRSDGQPDSETITYPDNTVYKRTLTYNSNNFLTSRSRWEKQ